MPDTARDETFPDPGGLVIHVKDSTTAVKVTHWDHVIAAPKAGEKRESKIKEWVEEFDKPAFAIWLEVPVGSFTLEEVKRAVTHRNSAGNQLLLGTIDREDNRSAHTVLSRLSLSGILEPETIKQAEAYCNSLVTTKPGARVSL